MKAGQIFQQIACRIGKHRLFLVEDLSPQAGLVECYYCKRQYALKFEGDNAGAMIPWEKAKTFYELRESI
jgi:hypothetical protein